MQSSVPLPLAPERPVANATRGVLLASATLTIMSGATIAPSLPGMRDVFADMPGADLLVRLVLTITALAIAVSAPLAGLAADRWGRRPLLIASLVLYALAGTSGFWVTGLPEILVGRALLGVAVAGVMTAGTALVADLFAGPARAAFLGLQSAFTSFGGVLFLPLGGFLAGLSWRDPFLVYLASLAIVPFALLFLPSTRAEARPEGAPRGPSPLSALPIYLLAFGGILIFYLGPTQLPFYLTNFGVPPSGTGITIALSTFAGAVASLNYARLRGRLSFGAIAAIALGLLGAGFALVGLAPNLAVVLAGLAVAGVGSGLLFPNLTVWLSGLAPAEARGRWLGLFTTASFLGMFLSPIVAQPLVARVGLGPTFAVAGLAAALIGALLALRARRAA